ncbi:hypothetical protein K7X08_034913 [Anisodus acutangulus]|uniref:Protein DETOXIFICATION n=1 Tax=Anisodus acutangulus TaxID=402998 RepID=A0A9Q1LG81_9SOLA|nr:hypothetical protein K7X08_034913 [Anisodus acutangulus]
MASALERLCGQAYGATQYHVLGIHMQRGMLVVVAISIPISIVWAFAGRMFAICGQDIELSIHAGVYARWLIPSILPYGLLHCQLKFLQTQSRLKPLLISTGFTSLIHVLLCWALVSRLGLGNKGASLCNAISYWINALILALYIRYASTCEKIWTGFSKEGARNLPSFLSLAIPSACMICLEQWSYEFLVLMSGLLPNPKLETSMMAISMSTSSLAFRIPSGFSSAPSTRISNEPGAGRPKAAKLAARIILLIAVVVAVAARNVWGYMYTNEEEVVKYLAAIMPVLALSNFMDGIQRALSGSWNLENRNKGFCDIAEAIEELMKQLELAGPLVLVSFLQYFCQMISIMFVGHLGELPLSSATLATSFAGVTGFSFMLGMGSALEKLCGQAYGAIQYNMLGIHMQRGMLVLVAIGIPISIIWAFAGHIFAFYGQDLELSIHAGLYARWLIPSIFPYGLLQCQLRFLQTHSRLKPLVISTGFTSLIHVLLCWVLVFRLGMGSKGAALCNAISYSMNVLILALYLRFAPSCKETWIGFSKEGARNLPSFLSLAIPSALMVCLEQWSYEFLVLMSGLLPNPKLETSMMAKATKAMCRVQVSETATVS